MRVSGNGRNVVRSTRWERFRGHRPPARSPAPPWCVTSATLHRMPAKNPRVNVVLERPIYDALGRLARRDGTTLSTKARDLLREALETYEDLGLAEMAEERLRTLEVSKLMSHAEVWKNPPGRKRDGGSRPRSRSV